MYNLHITRKGHWAEPGGPVITAEEWLAYVANDPQLKPIPESETHGVTVNVESKYPNRKLHWSSHSGDIYTEKPDVAVLAKMLQIASALGAKVQGDDGEVYGIADLNDGYFAGVSVHGYDRTEPKPTA
jgi:hypothetical protein